LKVIHIGWKPKSVQGKGLVFLREFWRLVIFHLLEKEGNRLIIRRFYTPKKEELKKLHDTFKKSKTFDFDKQIIKDFAGLSSPIAQELLENSIDHLFELLDTVPITEVDKPQEIGSALIDRRWNTWELSICDVIKYPPAPNVKSKFSPAFWRKYFSDLDQKLANFFFENLILNYEALISKEDMNQLRRKATIGYIEILVDFILNHPKWVFKSDYSSEILEKLASVDLEGCWKDFSDTVLDAPICEYRENISIILTKYLRTKGIPVSNEVISEAMKLYPYQFPEYYLGWIKDKRIDRIFLKTIRRTLINFPASAKEEIGNFLNRLQEKEKKWTVIIPVEGFQFPGGDINFKDLSLRFTNNIDFLNGKVKTQVTGVLKNYKEFVIIDQVSAMDQSMARYVACQKVRRVLDLLSFVLNWPVPFDPNPFSCVISKDGKKKTAKTFLLRGSTPKLECWKRPQNIDIILKFDRLITYSGKKNEEKLRRALRWLNKSLSEVDNEAKFLELWISFELLGGGSYYYKDNIPKILAEKYISSRKWSSLTIKQRYQMIYRERERAKNVVDFLGDIRSNLIVHAGKIDLPQLNYSVEQLHSMVRFLINEILAYLNSKSDKKEIVSDLPREMIELIDRIRGLKE